MDDYLEESENIWQELVERSRNAYKKLRRDIEARINEFNKLYDYENTTSNEELIKAWAKIDDIYIYVDSQLLSFDNKHFATLPPKSELTYTEFNNSTYAYIEEVKANLNKQKDIIKHFRHLVENLNQEPPATRLEITKIADFLNIDIDLAVKVIELVESKYPDMGKYHKLSQLYILANENTHNNFRKQKVSGSNQSTNSFVSLIQCEKCKSHFSSTFQKCPDCDHPVKFCKICKLSFAGNQNTFLCPRCGGEFHPNHFFEWVKIKGSCPICKSSLQLALFDT